MTSALLQQLKDKTTQAMREGQKDSLVVMRNMSAAVLQHKIDQKLSDDNITDALVLSIFDKMLKQRRDSIAQFEQGGRQELADKEKAEIAIIQAFLPEQLSEQDILNLIKKEIDVLGANSIKDMGKVMANIKPQIAGRADIGKASALVKQALSQ